MVVQKSAHRKQGEKFHKRSTSLLCKANELAHLVDANVYLVICRDNKYYTYKSNDSTSWPPGKHDIERNYENPVRKRPAHFKPVKGGASRAASALPSPSRSPSPSPSPVLEAIPEADSSGLADVTPLHAPGDKFAYPPDPAQPWTVGPPQSAPQQHQPALPVWYNDPFQMPRAPRTQRAGSQKRVFSIPNVPQFPAVLVDGGPS